MCSSSLVLIFGLTFILGIGLRPIYKDLEEIKDLINKQNEKE